MPPSLLFDLKGIDLDHVQYDVEAIQHTNPQRGAMHMLDGILYVNEGQSRAVAYKDVREDEFWVPGHIPGRPLFPGVLMIEAAAQLASFLVIRRLGTIKFMGFVAADQVKFRSQVVPGDRLYILGEEVQFRPRRFICAAQGVVNGEMVFEATVTGMPM